jgi:hypothetical protein
MINTIAKMVLKDHLSTRMPKVSLEAPLTKPPPIDMAQVISASFTGEPKVYVEPNDLNV